MAAHRYPEQGSQHERRSQQQEDDEQCDLPGESCEVTRFTRCLPGPACGETLTVHTTEKQRRSDKTVHPVVATLSIAVVGYVVLAALALALGALVTHFVVGHALGRDDLDIARWFADRRTPTWNDISVVGSYVAETVTVLVILAIALILLAVRRNWPQFGLLVVSMSVEAAVYATATFVISRNRPAVPRLEDLIVADSYPSGHTAASVALYSSLAIVVWSLTRNRWWRAITIALAFLAPIIVATSRVYRGMHNPTDVMCGALIGAGCVVVGYLSVRGGMAEAHVRHEREAPAETRPSLAKEAV
jgi:membrane-associated phospholipid phosphatase